jgi:hypothetical protein
MHDMARWGSYGIYVNGIGNLIIIDEGENPHTVVPWNSWVFTTVSLNLLTFNLKDGHKDD